MPENFERLRQWFENDMVPIKTSEMHSKNKRVGEFMWGLFHEANEKKARCYIQRWYNYWLNWQHTQWVYSKDTTQFIIEKSIKEIKDNTSECEMIVKTVTTLIKSKTKAKKFNVEEYQSKDYLEQHKNRIVSLLRLFRCAKTIFQWSRRSQSIHYNIAVWIGERGRS